MPSSGLPTATSAAQRKPPSDFPLSRCRCSRAIFSANQQQSAHDMRMHAVCFASHGRNGGVAFTSPAIGRPTRKLRVSSGHITAPLDTTLCICSRHHITKLLPLNTIVEYDTDLAKCGKLVSDEYRQLSGQTPADAVLDYLELAQRLNRYV